MDEIDLAQQNDELFRRAALAEHFRRCSEEFGAMLACGEMKSVGKLKPAQRRIMCLDCGDEIEPARRRANPAAVRCVECQSKKERNHGR